ncbi:FIG087842: Hypothetical protein [Alloactinosynnema sp. L-07]|nr:TIGR02678 family protein [Alloactinosynnema sp. L-07]CRK54965.1 FIG087842: Hypothetical protein [Alloactinosynnema sp. L-07]
MAPAGGRGVRAAVQDRADHHRQHARRSGRQGEAAFGRRRYVLLCLALAILERADAQITLGRLGGRHRGGGRAGSGRRWSLVHVESPGRAVRPGRGRAVLLEWGVLDRVAGEEDAYLSDTGDVLYDVRRRVLAALLTGQRGPSTIDTDTFERRLAELTDEPAPDTDELRTRALRHRLTRRLLEDPVVYYDELTPDERAYLVNQRHAITRRITEATG